jgi:hypothetical protein
LGNEAILAGSSDSLTEINVAIDQPCFDPAETAGRCLWRTPPDGRQLGDAPMATRKLAKSEWQSYFDRVSQSLGAKRVEIEVASLEIGDQIEANQVALKGLTYDPKSDVLEVVTEALDHMIQHPREIYVEESGDGLVTVEALDSDGNKQIIKLTSPLLIASDAA